MSQSDKSAADRARQRQFHRDRAIVKKIGKEVTAYAVDRMSEPELWLLINKASVRVCALTQEGRDVELARTARDLNAALTEVYLRGHQLTIWGEPTT